MRAHYLINSVREYDNNQGSKVGWGVKRGAVFRQTQNRNNRSVQGKTCHVARN